MKINETIKNIRASCDNYMDKDLVATIIHDNHYMGTNNILEFDGYGIIPDDSFEKRISKILKHENIFLAIGMYVFIPVINECDIYSVNDYNLKLTQKEFDKYANEKERIFGILIRKESEDFIIGSTDLCGCKIDASFKEIEKSDLNFYKKLEEIIDELIIY
ncbi:hypothetical protein [Methanobrevibacter sp.]|uniref:hypothetical protein n=1 Tax=Methanobrevibacter sp. TaxID=66852 RepID=UPI0026E02349|nr:hypothetical protein [Methanobrevibacter sp.]MDO5860000.1 hypothetical protein [Methanobrevibacter sp.]